MKKITLFSLCLVLLTGFVYSQNWDSVGSGINGQVYALSVYNGELYAGGNFTLAGGNNAKNIAKWNGSVWSAVGSGISGNSSVVFTLCVYNGELYAGGFFDSAGGILANKIARWNGVIWDSVLRGMWGGIFSEVNALYVYNGNLYAGGEFNAAGNSAANNIAMWNGSTWSALGLGTGIGINALTGYGGNLIAGGSFNHAGGNPVNHIAQWNGATWSAIGSGVNETNPGFSVICMASFMGKLYAGGFFDSAAGVQVNNVASWDGTAWDSVTSGVQSWFTVPQCFLPAYSFLYIGGGFLKAGNMLVNEITTWDGTNWDSVGAGLLDSAVYAVAIYNSRLYAGGGFRKSGNNNVQHIARWGLPVGILTLKKDNDCNIKVFPNPSTGIFNFQPPVVCSQWSVEVYNVLGEKVFSNSNQLLANNYQLDLRSQPNGIYFYRVLGEDGTMVGNGKLIINR